jgi:hypothetical protein
MDPWILLQTHRKIKPWCGDGRRWALIIVLASWIYEFLQAKINFKADIVFVVLTHIKMTFFFFLKKIIIIEVIIFFFF